jgi:hypothetical protein
MISLNPNFNEDDLIPLGYLQANISESEGHLLRKNDLPVFSGTYQMIHQNRDVMLFMDILAHNSKGTLGKKPKQASGN